MTKPPSSSRLNGCRTCSQTTKSESYLLAVANTYTYIYLNYTCNIPPYVPPDLFLFHFTSHHFTTWWDTLYRKRNMLLLLKNVLFSVITCCHQRQKLHKRHWHVELQSLKVLSIRGSFGIWSFFVKISPKVYRWRETNYFQIPFFLRFTLKEHKDTSQAKRWYRVCFVMCYDIGVRFQKQFPSQLFIRNCDGCFHRFTKLAFRHGRWFFSRCAQKPGFHLENSVNLLKWPKKESGLSVFCAPRWSKEIREKKRTHIIVENEIVK